MIIRSNLLEEVLDKKALRTMMDYILMHVKMGMEAGEDMTEKQVQMVPLQRRLRLIKT